MPPSRNRAVLGFLFVAIVFTGNLTAKPLGSQDDPAAKEPVDTSAPEAISHGVAAFKDTRYAAATLHFKKAIALDPKSTQARLYLGITYASQVVPNLDTPDNLATANSGIDILKQIPEGAPEHLSSLRQIAFLYHNTKRFDEAKATELQILKLAPNDASANFTIGVIDWKQAYNNAVAVLTTAGLTDDGVGNSNLTTAACQALREKNSPLVKDGIDHLTRAITAKPDHEDAMQYMNLTYRRQADLACGNNTNRSGSIALAEQWSSKAMAVRKQKQLATASTQ